MPEFKLAMRYFLFHLDLTRRQHALETNDVDEVLLIVEAEAEASERARERNTYDTYSPNFLPTISSVIITS